MPRSQYLKVRQRAERRKIEPRSSSLLFLPPTPLSPSDFFPLCLGRKRVLSTPPMSARLPSFLRVQPSIRGTAPLTRPRHFSSSPAAQARELDHYEQLGVKKDSSKQVIKNKFYEVSPSPSALNRADAIGNPSSNTLADPALQRQLSRIYHPDAPSSSSSESIASRTAKFQHLSQSYAVLSDDTLRRRYDQSLEGYASGRRPTYTSGAGHESGSGFGGGAAAAWSTGSNNARRERANYAWSHPSRRGADSSEAKEAGERRQEQFRRGQGAGQSAQMDDHYKSFATREARTRLRTQANQTRQHGPAHHAPGSPFSSGTAGFGAKAEEESRLINDSGAKRSGQVRSLWETGSWDSELTVV